MPLLKLSRISKSFGVVQALDQVDFHIDAGEVLGLIGENGAGKSTLMKALGGVHAPSSGSVFVDDRKVEIRSAKEAERLGISFVHQELNLLDNLDVAANIFLGREPRKFACMDRKRLTDMAKPLLHSLGLEISPHTPLSRLTNGQKQMVEIAKALSFDARVLILDEPTSSLTIQETDTLLNLVEKLKEKGLGIIFITHRLAEIEQIADRVVALRDGERVGELSKSEIIRERMISLMIGRDLSDVYPKNHTEKGEAVFEVRNFSTQRWPLGNANFKIRKGEILGLAGLVGSGRSELAQAIFGVDRSPSGEFSVNGALIERGKVKEAIRNGIFLAPEDRKSSGLVLEMSIRENMSLNSMSRFSRYGRINKSQERRSAQSWLEDFRVKAPSAEHAAGNLSGGNQQKVVLAKWMTLAPNVMIFDEPTRGIDMGARHEIYQSMIELAQKGCAILMISSDMEELLGMSDRIAVMCEGHLTGTLEKDQFSEEGIMSLAVQIQATSA